MKDAGRNREMHENNFKILKSGKICNAAFSAGETISIDGSLYMVTKRMESISFAYNTVPLLRGAACGILVGIIIKRCTASISILFEITIGCIIGVTIGIICRLFEEYLVYSFENELNKQKRQ